jgi:hypothetical protein
MLPLVFGLLWGGYALAFHGWSLWQRYDLTFLESINPANGGYSGPWPPPQIQAGDVLPGGASKASSKGTGPGGSTPVPGSAAVIPKVAGQCPKGYIWDPGSKTCLQELG